MIKITSPVAKRVLAKHLSDKDPDFLHFLKMLNTTFGTLGQIDYQGEAEASARKELLAMTKTAAETALKQTKEALK